MARSPTPVALSALLLLVVLVPPLLVHAAALLVRLFSRLSPFEASAAATPDSLHWMLAQLLTVAALAPAFGVQLGGAWGLGMLGVADETPAPAEASKAAPARKEDVSGSAGDEGPEETEDERRKREM